MFRPCDIQHDHFVENLELSANLTAVWEISGKVTESCLLLISHLEQCQHLAALCMHIFYTW